MVITRPDFPYFYKKKYYNHTREKAHGFFLNSLFMFFYSRIKRLQRKKPDLSNWTTPCKLKQSRQPTITWIGHSTFLIQCGTIKILTDPIFGNASLLFKRIIPPAITIKEIVTLDYVLLSHNHRDHMDEKSLRELKKLTPSFLIPVGDKKWFDRRNFTHAKEHSWWQSTQFTHDNNSLIFTFLPAQHWSQRVFFDRNRSLWGSWMIQYNGYTIYFAGDTAYAPHFKQIKEKFPQIDVALMPIGPCQPKKWMQHSHINAQEAGQAFLDLGARNFIPMHWGTFYFGTDSFSTPITYLTDWWKNEPLVSQDQLQILKFGQSWQLQEKINASQITQQQVENVVL